MISILTPTFNQAPYIGTAITSVLAQTYSAWELIVVDDGSADATGEIVRSYNDPRIRYVCQPHVGLKGLASTYNRGLAMACGEFIAILEGDDFWPPNKLQIQDRALRATDAVLSYGRVNIADADSKIIGDLTRWIPKTVAIRENRPVGASLGPLLTAFFTFPVGLLIRRQALTDIGGFIQPDGVFVVDLPTVLELACLGPFSYTDEVVGYWRRHRKQTTFLRPEDAVGLRAYCLARARRLPEEGFPVDPEIHRNLDRDARKATNSAAFRSVRILMADGAWDAAKKQSGDLLVDGPTAPRKLAAFGCYLGSIFRVDLEWLARQLGREDLPPRER